MRKRFIKIHNELSMAKYKMTLAEQKLFIYAIKNINQDDSNFSEVKFTVSDFAEDTDLDLKYVYKEIDSMTTNIMKTIIFIRDKKLSDKWRKYNLTQSCFYNKGTITFKFNEDMRVFLLQLQEHYYLQAPVVITFKSWYSMRLYDIFKAYSYKNKELHIALDELKEVLDLQGKYERFNNFREKVVDVALDEINTKSDIKVSYDKETRGVKVIGLFFSIEDKVNDEYSEQLHELIDIYEIKNRTGLIDSGFSNKQILKAYEHTVDRFEKYRNAEDLYLYMYINYQYTKIMKQDGNVYGYYLSCVQNDYAKAIPQIMTGHLIG